MSKKQTKSTDEMTSQEYLEYMADQAAKKPSKYLNTWVMFDGINFQSQAERDRYIALCYLRDRGEIKSFTRQKLFKFIVNGVLITSWRADFIVYTWEGGVRVEDVKGVITGEYLIKKALMRACYGIEIYEPNLAEPATKRTRKKQFKRKTLLNKV